MERGSVLYDSGSHSDSGSGGGLGFRLMLTFRFRLRIRRNTDVLTKKSRRGCLGWSCILSLCVITVEQTFRLEGKHSDGLLHIGALMFKLLQENKIQTI